MTKILHVIESLEFGGAEKVVVQLANRFSEIYDVTICMTKRRGQLCESVDQKIKQFCLSGSEGNDYSVIGKLASYISENEIDIVHIHNWSVYVEGVLAAKRAGVTKIIHTIHGPYMAYGNNLKSKLKKYIRHKLEHYLSRYVSAFVPVSNSIQEYIVKDMSICKSKIHVIHNGVKGLNVDNKKHNQDNNILRLVMVGRVAKIKNHMLMLDAMKELVNQIDVLLVIVGDGPDLDEIKNYAEANNLSQYIQFLGFRTDIENILSDKDIFLLTSFYEGISIALLESMSMGLPTIATRVGGMPEAVIPDETGILIESGDKDGLVTAIKYMFKHPDLMKKMGLAAHEYFMREFNEDIVIEQYKQLYKSIYDESQ